MTQTTRFRLNRFDPDHAGRYADLWSVIHPPETLHVEGHENALPLLERVSSDGLAIVGTRYPQARSLEFLRGEVRKLRNSPLILVSGFARGIDAQAHRSALECGLPTIAILAGGLDALYPPEHAELAAQIVQEGGLLVSERDHHEPPKPFQFIQRNRLIGGWSRATWIVEAPFRSGSLNTANWARQHGRPCLATPSFPGDRALSGNQKLLDSHGATFFWGVHNLGEVWLDLSNRGYLSTLATSAPSATPTAPEIIPTGDDAKLLLQEIQTQTAQKGGALVNQLLDWTSNQGWATERFFTALQILSDQSLILDARGLIVSL